MFSVRGPSFTINKKNSSWNHHSAYNGLFILQKRAILGNILFVLWVLGSKMAKKWLSDKRIVPKEKSDSNESSVLTAPLFLV